MRERSSLTLGVGILATLGVIGGCGGDGSGGGGPGGPGLADVQLHVPPGVTDGIALVTVTGGTVKTVRSAGSEFRAVGAGTRTARIIARGSFSGSTAKLATICIDRIEDLADFHADVNQVAGGQAAGYALRDVAPYSASLDNPRPTAGCS